MTSLTDLRRAELDLVKPYIYEGARVLEVGGGNGFQAMLLAELGADVKSIDISQPVDGMTFFNVDVYDGNKIPFPDRSFDIVFSSNVLEHVRDFDGMLLEISRVLKQDGLCIQILPTPTWRFWTSLTHYIYIVMRCLWARKQVAGGALPSVEEKIKNNGLLYVLKRVLIAGPHGEYDSAFSELFYFRKNRWKSVFIKNGFEVSAFLSGRVFYTGYSIFPSLTIEIRKLLSMIIGSSTYVYVLRKKK